MRADSGRAVMCARSRRAYARRFAGAHAFLATCAQITGALQATDPPTTTYRVWLWRNSGAQSILHWCAQIRGALSCAQGHGAHMRVDCWHACILGHLRANHGRAASYKPTNHNLQSMTVKKLWNTRYLTLMRARSRRAYARRFAGAHAFLATCAQIMGALQATNPPTTTYRVWLWRNSGNLWNTKYLTLMCADSGRAVMRARSRRAYARRLLARMHFWPPAPKSWARCKLQTHQPQLTEYDCDESSGTQSILHSCAQIQDALSCAQGHGAHMRVDCWRACNLGHPARKSRARCKLQTHQPLEILVSL